MSLNKINRPFPFAMLQPPQGRYAAVTDMTAPGARILYRDITLDGPAELQFTVPYDKAGPFFSPAGLDFDGCQPNQQFRVELLDRAAPPDTTDPTHVLALFATAPGDPPRSRRRRSRRTCRGGRASACASASRRSTTRVPCAPPSTTSTYSPSTANTPRRPAAHDSRDTPRSEQRRINADDTT